MRDAIMRLADLIAEALKTASPDGELVAYYAAGWEAELRTLAQQQGKAGDNVEGKVGVVPEGWQLVPRVMTLEMDVAFCEAWFSRRRPIDDSETQDAWEAMLAAAPAPDHSAGVGRKVLGSLREFARWAIRNSAFDGCDLDGGSVQDKAVELGLITQFDVTEACGEDCRCAEFGFPSVCCRFSVALAQPADSDGKTEGST